MSNSISDFVRDRKDEYILISSNRKDELNLLAQLVSSEIDRLDHCKMNIICTHNSRRSQLAEFLIRIAADEMNIDSISTFSGGTEATAFNHRMVAALSSFGFDFDTTENGSNPIYKFRSNKAALQPDMFSKKYSDDYNPQKDFIAVMVCDHADENCPVVFGSSHRFSLPYLDPKASDDTADEAATYEEKVKEVGREMVYFLEQVKAVD